MKMILLAISFFNMCGVYFLFKMMKDYGRLIGEQNKWIITIADEVSKDMSTSEKIRFYNNCHKNEF